LRRACGNSAVGVDGYNEVAVRRQLLGEVRISLMARCDDVIGFSRGVALTRARAGAGKRVVDPVVYAGTVWQLEGHATNRGPAEKCAAGAVIAVKEHYQRQPLQFVR